MDLKNRRIALQIDDPQLRWQLSQLLMQNGAAVHRAKDEEELQRLVDKVGVEVVVATVAAEYLEPPLLAICSN